MIRLLRFLFTGSWHEHKWTTIQSGTLGHSGRVYGMRYILRCDECGKITNKDCQ